MSRWRYLLAQLFKKLWVRAAIYAVLAVAAALLAAAFSPLVPAALAEPFGGDTVNGLLNMLASSLLAVATFSVAAMLTAYTNVSQGATPRAAALITGDSQAQTALASFIGAFLYAAVAYSALGTGYYAGGGRAILFFVTLAVLAYVAVTLLRWLDQLLSLARVGYAIAQVEKATYAAMMGVFGPGGARGPNAADPPAGATEIEAGEVGYVLNVDVGQLEKLAERHDLFVWVRTAPGAFADMSRPLALVTGRTSAKALAAIRATFELGPERSFSQDPRFGMVVLGEVASRALSPGINDPGTAISVIASAVRLFSRWIEAEARSPDTPPNRVHLPRLFLADALDDVFTPVARDGAGSLSVAMRLQVAFTALACRAQGEERALIDHMAGQAMERSAAKMDFPADVERVRRARTNPAEDNPLAQR